MSSPAAVWPASDNSTNSALRHLLQKVLHTFGADHVGELAADQQDRDRQIDHGLLELLHPDERDRRSGAVRNAGSQCQYHRPSRSRRFFFSPSGLRGFVRYGRYAATASAASSSVSKPLHAAEHEVANAGAAVLLIARHHVDEHQLGHLLRPCRVGDEHAGHAAHAGADQDHRPADLVEHGQRVGAQRIHRVVRVGRPVAVAVAAAVQGDDVQALRRPGSGRCSSRRTGSARRRAASGPSAVRRRRARRRGSIRRRPE